MRGTYLLVFTFLLSFILASGKAGGKEWLGVSDRRKMGLLYEAKQSPFSCYATSQETADRALRIIWATYEKARKELGAKQGINKSCVVCIWDDEAEYEKHAARYARDARHAFAFAMRNVLPNTDAVFGYVRKDFFEETLPHEIGHLVLYNLTDPSARTNPPSWLHEGFAQLQEGNLKRSMEKARLRILKAREEDEFLPVWQLTAPKRPPSPPSVFYSEALVFVSYLIENQVKEDAFWKLCRYICRNRKKEFETYFRIYYPQFKDIYDINGRWEESVVRDLKSKGERKLAAASEAMGEGRVCMRRKETRAAFEHYKRAFHDLVILISDYDKVDEHLFDEDRAWKLIGTCAHAIRSIGDRETMVKVLPGDTIDKAEKSLEDYNKERGDNEWVYDELGLSVRFDEMDRVEEVKLSKPRAGKVGGIKVGDKLEDLLSLHGEFLPYRVAQMQGIFLERAGQVLPGPDMECFEEGSYPVISSSGRYLGALVREAVDMEKEGWEQGSWFYVGPMTSGGVISLVELDGEEISGIVLVCNEDMNRIAVRRIKKGSRRILPLDRKLTLKIGDKEHKVVDYLGQPKKRKPYTADTRRPTDRARDSELIYPGLEIIIESDRVTSIYATEPSQASIYGIKIGDSLEKVIQLRGSSTDLMDYEKRKRMAQVSRKDRYVGLFLEYEEGNTVMFFKINKQKVVSLIYAYE